MKNLILSFLGLLFGLLLSGCATNDYASFYSSNAKNLPYVERCKVKYPIIDELFDLGEVQEWRNKGYEVIGTSSFQGLWTPRTKAIDVARRHCAEVVLVYYELEEEREEEETFVVPHRERTYHHGTIYGYGSSASYSGYSTSVSYIPVSISYTNRYYSQKAFYLAKRRAINSYGVYFVEPPNIPGRAINEAVVVDIVITGSPAEKAGIKVGDVVVSINGQSISSFEEAKPFMLGQLAISSMEVSHE